jgi:hypothetical protein
MILWARLLTYAGTLPLLTMALMVYLMPEFAHHARVIASTYSAVIISFLCGIHWAVYIFFAKDCPRHLLLTSNALALCAWASILFGASFYTFAAQMICFLYLLYLDRAIKEAGLYPLWFYKLRCEASAVVLVSLGAMMAQGSF